MSLIRNLPPAVFEQLKRGPLASRGYNGVMIDEFVVDWPNGNKKMIWVLKGHIFSLIDSAGNQVPLFHAEYKGSPDGEQVARQRLQLLWEQNTKMANGTPLFNFTECHLADPFERISKKLRDTEFLKIIATYDPENKALQNAIMAVKMLGLLANYDVVNDAPTQPPVPTSH
jgi:hypothetical protein